MSTRPSEFSYDDRLHLVVAEGPSTGRQLLLEETCAHQGLVVGRSKACGFQLSDKRASRAHFTLFFRDGSWRVRDLGSCNGTLVNEVRVSVDVAVSAGDSIRAGDTRLLVSKASVHGLSDDPIRRGGGEPPADPYLDTYKAQ